MRALRKILLTICLLPLTAFADGKSWDQSMWNPATKTRVSAAEALQTLAPYRVFVIGEEHYNPAVQAAEGALIRIIGGELPNKDNVLVGWEFLNTENRSHIEQSYARYLGQELSTEDFLQALFPTSSPPLEYAPLLEAARAVNSWLIPTNLTRAQKMPVTRGGIDALDPALRPKDFELGGPSYFERFQDAMGPHPLPYPIENYFASQSLTDEVMATELLGFPTEGRRILVTGSFHGDYRDGATSSLARRTTQDSVIYIKVLDASAYTEADIFDLFVHPKYGPIADLIYIVNEPSLQ